MNTIPPLVRKLAYAGLIPFIGLALMVQLAPTPLNYLSAESLAGYGAVITAFTGALHWGASLHTLGKAPSGDRWIDRNAFMTIRNRLTYIAAACLTWSAIVILFIQAWLFNERSIW